MCHVLRLPLFTAATAKRLKSNVLFPSFKFGNNSMEPRERLPGVSRFPASAAGLPADGSNSVWFPPAATFYKFAAEVNLTFLPKARRMWYDRKNVKMRRI
jgi:hypothetical protein